MVASETTSSKACKLYQVSNLYNEGTRTRTMKKKIKTHALNLPLKTAKFLPF